VCISFGPSCSDGKNKFKKLLTVPLTCIPWSVEGTTNPVNRIGVRVSPSVEFPDFLDRDDPLGAIFYAPATTRRA
jgi:hypothetical protein